MDLWTDLLDGLVGQPVPAGVVVGRGPSGMEVGFQLIQVDATAVSLVELELVAPQVTMAGVLDVRAWVDEICHRATYLLEHMGVLEVDAQGGTVLARSVPPTKSGGTTRFYELRGDIPARLRFRRVQTGGPAAASGPTPTAGATAQPLVLTREVLGRWLDDVAAAGRKHLPGF